MAAKKTNAKFAALQRRYHFLLRQAGVTEDQKEAMLGQYFVTSSSELTVTQLGDVCDGLQKLADAKKEVPLSTRRLRSQVLDLLTQIGVYKTSSDWSSVNNYLMNKRIAGKLLPAMDETELKALIRKLKMIAGHLNEEQKELDRKSKEN